MPPTPRPAPRLASAVRIGDLANSQYGLVAGWQLRGMGMSRGQIRAQIESRRLIPVRPGVLAVGHVALSRPGILMSGVLAGGPGALLSHQSAALLWQFEDRFRSPLHILGSSSRLRPGGHSRIAPPLRVHRTNHLDSEDCATRQGIPVTSVARTFSDLATVEPTERLQVRFNQATRAGFVDIEAMRRIVIRTNGKRGAAKLDRILRRWHPLHRLARSEMENRFLELCRQAGFPEPRVNEPLLGMVVDFYWPEIGLVIELDSREFHEDSRGHERDRERTARLELAGYRVLRLTWAMIVFDEETTTRKVREYFRLARETATARVGSGIRTI